MGITGIGCLSGAGVGAEKLLSAMRGPGFPAEAVEIETIRGRRRSLRLARLSPFDRQAYLPSRKLRRMGELSQLSVIACLMARSDAGWDAAETAPPPPERRGIFLGTGFGCTDTTWAYLTGMFQEGAAMANPYYFSESVANAPAGHSAIELDARGANVTLTVGDASAGVALDRAARSIRDGRLEMAYCGAVETMSEPLLRILAGLSCPDFVGEGCVCLLLETLEGARARNARVYAEVAGTALASDSGAPAARWSRDPEAIARPLRQAVAAATGEGDPAGARVRAVFLHAAGYPESDAAEIAAAEATFPGVARTSLAKKTGAFAAAGGLNLVAAALEAADPAAEAPGRSVIVSFSSWGGTLAAAILRDGGAGRR